MRALLIVTILIITACTSNKDDLIRYEGGRQLLTVNKTDRFGNKIILPKIGVVVPENVYANQPLNMKVFLEEKGNFKLIDAYCDCIEVANPSVDTIPDPVNKFKRLSGCSTGLINSNDTIYIYLIPRSIGKKTFNEITLLTRDKEKIYRTQKYTFDYTVNHP